MPRQFAKLIDKFKRVHDYLRISLTEKCNLRCSYCMPEQAWTSAKLMTKNEILLFSHYFIKRGVVKIRLTGGEPLMRRDLIEILVSKLKDAGLDSVNISLDSLKPERVLKLTGLNVFKLTMASIVMALDVGLKSVRINCVVMRDFNDDELCDFVELTRFMPVDVRFIEYMPFGGNQWKFEKLVSYNEMLKIIKLKYPSIYQLDGHPSDTTKYYQLPNWSGRVGFITSMTEHFCGGCSRLRLTADGNMKSCLHSDKEQSLVDVLRKHELDIDNKMINSFGKLNCALAYPSPKVSLILDELDSIVDQNLMTKASKHAGMDVLTKSLNRSMVRIGG